MRSPDRITLLSIASESPDHLALQSLMRGIFLLPADNISDAISLLVAHPHISVVVCDRDLPWPDLLRHLKSMASPPELILSADLPDRNFWTEALNLGVWDVLQRPFRRTDALRVIQGAWEHWIGKRPKVRTAAG